MKIKNQLILLLFVLAFVPVFYFLPSAIIRIISNSEDITTRNLKDIAIIDAMDISKKDKQVLKNLIRARPYDIEDAFILTDGDVILSTIPEIDENDIVDFDELWPIMLAPDETYYYTLNTLPIESIEQSMLYITKYYNTSFEKQRRRINLSERVRNSIFIITLIAEIICLIFALLISNRISKSIAILENNTELLNDGRFETPISMPKQLRSANEITALSKNLETLRLTLKELKNRRDRLIMGISHDLRTPIAIIKGYAEAINDGLINDEQKTKDAINIIRSKTEQLDDMIESLIDFVKFNSNEWQKNLKETDLSEFVEYRKKVTQEAGELFNRNVIVTTEIPKGTMVKMDMQLVDRAFENLFVNAIRYTKEGDSIYTKYIIKDNVAELSIQDTGIGISKEDLDQIFDLFYRASHSRNEGGMGIGLAIVKNIIETHGWNITVESELGVGTTFTIRIPLPPPTHQQK